MSLPNRLAKKIVSVIAVRPGKADMKLPNEVKAPGSEMDPSLQFAAEDILRAVEEKSPLDLAHALQSFFQICDSADQEMPELEEEHA